MTEETKQKIHVIADEYGFRPQSRQCIEECSELIKALCKWDRRWGDSLLSDSHKCKERDDVITEIADCKIMLEQIEHLMSAEYDVMMEIERKIARQMERIEKNA